MTAISDFGDAFMTHGWDAKIISLKIWDFLINVSIISDIIDRFAFSRNRKLPRFKI